MRQRLTTGDAVELGELHLDHAVDLGADRPGDDARPERCGRREAVDEAAFPTSAAGILDALAADGTTGVLVHPDSEALALVDLAHARGIQVPHDMSFIAYDDEIARLGSPALTAVHPSRHDLGRAAFDVLLGRLADPDRTTHRVLLSPSLQVRASTAAPGS
ncbi:MAG: substrate-binding domain-containing protein [Microbacterium sp.]